LIKVSKDNILLKNSRYFIEAELVLVHNEDNFFEILPVLISKVEKLKLNDIYLARINSRIQKKDIIRTATHLLDLICMDQFKILATKENFNDRHIQEMKKAQFLSGDKMLLECCLCEDEYMVKVDLYGHINFEKKLHKEKRK
jgi:hypothetical protein